MGRMGYEDACGFLPKKKVRTTGETDLETFKPSQFKRNVGGKI